MRPQILVPFDFGPASNAALVWATDLQQSLGGPPLHIIHVLVPPRIPAREGPEPFPTDTDIAEVRAELRQIVDTIGAVATTEVTAASSVEPAILDAAQRVSAGLIVMGTHGRTGVSRLLLGSVADHLVRNAACPVVTMRAPAAASAIDA
jgi:universal stress protein A